MFPRGGGEMDVSKFARSESNRKRDSLDRGNDALFPGASASKRLKRMEQSKTPNNKDKKKRKSSNDSDDEDGVLLRSRLKDIGGIGLGATRIVERGATRIETLTASRYPVGAMALGYVLNVTKSVALISLPGGLTGTVEFSEVSDLCAKLFHKHERETSKSSHDKKQDHCKADPKEMPVLAKLLAVHQPVRCVVLENSVLDVGSQGSALNGGSGSSAKRKRTLKLSLRLSVVNRGLTTRQIERGQSISATVLSEEDGGFMMDSGLRGVHIFLPKAAKRTGEKRLEHDSLVPGITVECVVDSVNEGAKTITLRRRGGVEAPTNSSNVAFSSITPGMLVECTVRSFAQVTAPIASCRFLSYFPYFVRSFLSFYTRKRQQRAACLALSLL